MTEIQTIADSGPTIETALTYTTDTGERLAYQISETSEGEDDPAVRERYAVHQVPVHDVRPFTDTLSLDREGFILRRIPSAVADFYDAGEVSAVYEPEIERLVKQETGAEKMVIFDHTIRVESDEKRRAMKAREIVNLAHNDYTVKSGPQRVRDLLRRRLAETIATYSFTAEEQREAQKAGLGDDDTMFDDSLREIYEQQSRLVLEDEAAA